jgi:hypothetical protein
MNTWHAAPTSPSGGQHERSRQNQWRRLDLSLPQRLRRLRLGEHPHRTTSAEYVYGATRDIVHEKWIKLQAESRRGPVATRIPTLAAYLTAWHAEVIVPNSAPATGANYGMFIRLYIIPWIGDKRLDKLSVRDVQTWLNKLRITCQCCAQA